MRDRCKLGKVSGKSAICGVRLPLTPTRRRLELTPKTGVALARAEVDAALRSICVVRVSDAGTGTLADYWKVMDNRIHPLDQGQVRVR